MNEKGVSPPPRQSLFDALGFDEQTREIARKAGASRVWAAWERWYRLVTKAMPLIQVFTVTWNPEEVSANTTEEQTVTVIGVKLDRDVVLSVTKPTHTAGLVIGNARVSADDSVAVTLGNLTGTGINPGSEDYVFVTMRK